MARPTNSKNHRAAALRRPRSRAFRMLARVALVAFLAQTVLPTPYFAGDRLLWAAATRTAEAAPPTPFDPPPGLPPSVVVSRRSEPTTVDQVTDGRVALLYEVVNRRPEPLDVVLLRTRLAAGVRLIAADPPADSDGQEVAVQLGRIEPGQRASVRLDVEATGTVPTELDTGADVVGFLDGLAVSAGTQPTTLAASGTDPALLACTLDADCADPVVRTLAARLDHDVDRIFAYVRDEVAYEPYGGSLRGARGAAWSRAGNAVDQSSLLIALLRAAGVPARYVSGSLGAPEVLSLLRSTYPDDASAASFVPDGEPLADPENDPALRATIEAHTWVELDRGSGFEPADPSFAGLALGAEPGTRSNVFTEVAPSDRHQVRFALDIELKNLFVTGIPPRRTVLDETLPTVSLVGRPVSVGNLVTSRAAGGIVFSETRHAYTPYLSLPSASGRDDEDDLRYGDPFDELKTNFAGASAYLTGYFLTLESTAPDGTTHQFERALVDRIGPAARTRGGAVADTPLPDEPAHPGDSSWVVGVRVSGVAAEPMARVARRVADLEAAFAPLRPLIESGSDLAAEDVGKLSGLAADAASILGEVAINRFELLAHGAETTVASLVATTAFVDRPQLTIAKVSRHEDSIALALDIVDEGLRAIPPPSQAATAAAGVAVNFTALTNAVEGQLLDELVPSSAPATTAIRVVAAAGQQGVTLTTLVPGGSRTALDALPVDDDARARIARALEEGRAVVAPATTVELGGEPAYGWLELFPDGRLRGRLPDGSGGAFANAIQIITTTLSASGGVAFIGGFTISIIEGMAALLLGFLGEINGQAWGGGFDVAAALKSAAQEVWVGLAIAIAASCAAAGPYYFFCLGGGLAGMAVWAVGLGALAADPALPPMRMVRPSPRGPNIARQTVARAADVDPSALTSVAVSAPAAFVVVDGPQETALQAATLGATTTDFAAPAASVEDLGTGAVASGDATIDEQPAAGVTATFVSGDVVGTGRTGFFAGFGGVGGSAAWSARNAVLAGGVSVDVAPTSLLVDGELQPTGAYRLSATTATLGGEGTGLAPSLASDAAVDTTDATVSVGPSSTPAAGWPAGLDTSHGATLTGFTGSVAVAAAVGDHAVDLTGSAQHVLALGSPGALAVMPGGSFGFSFPLQTSLADDYELSLFAPPGWEVEIDDDGEVTISLPGGEADGDAFLQLRARSVDRPKLVATAQVPVTIGAGSPAVSIEIAPDPLFSVLLGEVPIESSFVATIRNLGPLADGFALSIPSPPAGFRVDLSRDEFDLDRGGRAEIGIYLTPVGTLPPPNTEVSFDVEVASRSQASIQDTATLTYRVGDIYALGLRPMPERVVLSPGDTGSFSLLATNIGNVTAAADLEIRTAPEVAVSAGFPTALSVPAGDAQSIPGSLVVDANAEPGTEFQVLFDPDLCQGTPVDTCPAGEIARRQVGLLTVEVRSPEVAPLAEAAVIAAASAPDLAKDLDALADDLQLLVSDPGRAALCSRVQRSASNLAARLRAVPALASLAPTLDALAASAVGCDVPTLLADAANAAQTLLAGLEAFTRAAFAMSITPPTVLVGPGGSGTLTLHVENRATEAQTIALASAGLPAGAGLGGLPTDVSLAVGESVALPLTLTHPGGATEIFPLAIDGTSSNAPVSEQATAIARALPSLAEILAVDATPRTPAPGTLVALSAELRNAANAPLDLLADVSLLDEARQPLASNPTRTLPVSLAGGGAPTTIDLGSEATGGLPGGVYYVRVALRNAGDGSPAALSSIDTPVVIGGLVEASVTVDPMVVPPGDSNLTTTVVLETANAGNGAASARIELLKTHFETTPDSRQVVVTPIVVDLDVDGFPEIVFGTYRNFGSASDRLLRAITTRPRAVVDENLARFAIAWAESDVTRNDANPPRNAHDGDLSTPFRTVTDTTTENQVFEMHFGDGVTVRQVNLLARGNNSKAESGIFELLALDGSVLATSGDIAATANGNDRDFVVPFPDTAGVHTVRFTSTDLPGNTMRINEFEVIGDATVRGDEVFSIAPAGFEPNSISEIAAADIDDDGFVELFIRAQTGNALLAFEHDGTPKWRAALARNPGNGAPAVADLDGDGTPEIVFGSNVVDADGNLLWSGTINQGEGSNAIGALSLVADVDLDGSPEIVAGDTLYEADGTEAWRLSGADGTNAVANFDADDEAEVVLVRGNEVSLYEHDGTRVWGPVAVANTNRLGPPTVADFDADGAVEIGVAGAEAYTVFDTDGSILWDAPTVDASSRLTGSTVFDFEGDGAFEVIYGDEQFLRVYRGSDGTPLTAIEKSSRTRLEMPVVADADGDGNAEIVASASSDLGGKMSGVMLVGGADEPWRPTRKIWNQHTYHVTNVNEDGSVPTDEAESWLVAGLNTFRSNEFSPLDTGGTVTVSHRVSNLVVDAGSIDPAPTATSADEITWEIPAIFAGAPPPLTFEAALLGAEPGSVVQVSERTLVDALVTLGDGSQVRQTVELPPQLVAVSSIIAIAPDLQSVEAGDTASFDVTLTNPSAADATIDLGFVGLPDASVSLAASTLVPAGGSVVVPLDVTPPLDATPALAAFAVEASFPGGGREVASAELLIEAPTASPPGLETRAVSLSIVGSGIAAGPGTTAAAAVPGSSPVLYDRPALRIANLGDTTQTYDLALAGPGGWSASLDEPRVVVAPGLVNAVDVPITLVAPLAATPGTLPFSATATDVAEPSSSDAATSSVTVLGPGLTLSLTPPTGAPGDVFDLTVTNTGNATETFDLVAGGAAAADTAGLPSAVTVAAGASQLIPLTVGDVGYVLPGTAALIVEATAQTQPAVFARTQALVTIPETRGLGIALSPPSLTIDTPGTVDVQVDLANEGTLDDRVELRIIDVSGPISASLRSPIGNGLRVGGALLPGGALGVMGLEVTPLAGGTATVTVEVRSERDPSVAASATATFTISLAPTPTPTPTPTPSPTPTLAPTPTPTTAPTPAPSASPSPGGSTVVEKFAAPGAIPVPGADVTFTFVLRNQSPTAPSTVDGLVDDVYGDLNGQGSCSFPQSLAPGGTYTCSLTAYVASPTSGLHENVVTMFWTDDAGAARASQSDARVPILAPSEIVGCPHCPAKVSFRNPYDYFAVAAVLDLPPTFDPRGHVVSVVLENSSGTILTYSLLPGELRKSGRHFVYKDRQARKNGGILKVDMFYLSNAKHYRFKIRAYGDYSAADEADMRVRISVGPHLFAYEGTWRERQKGWYLRRLPLP